MDMQTAVITCFKKFLTIQGRASRSEFWWFWLFCMIMNLFLSVVALTFYKLAYTGNSSLITYYEIASTIPGIWSLVIILPITCAYIRRLHDIGTSGWWALIIFIPLIGWIGFFVIGCTKGEEGKNRFGANPLAE